MKTADEIKKGLECSVSRMCTGPNACPYHDGNDFEGRCINDSRKDAFVYIQQLEAERNQALQDIQMLGRMGSNICILCEHYNHGEGSAACVTCPKLDNFKWRGVPAKEG